MRKVIEVKHLYKLYRLGNEVVRALDGVDFTIYEGEFCAIVGTSGSGKSTLLGIIAGWIRPVSGEMSKQNVDSMRWVFQNPHGIAQRTVIDHVSLPLLAKGFKRE